MNLNKEDPIYKKAQIWSPEEYKPLVQMTKEKIQLDEQDCSRKISWSDHWANVSSYLKKKGHSRTHHACKNYWHRVAKFEVEATGIRHRSSDSSDTAISASNSLDDSRSNKRGLPQDMNICGERGNTRQCKKSRAGVILGQEAVESSRALIRGSSERGSENEYPGETWFSRYGDGCQVREPRFSDASIQNLRTMDRTGLVATCTEVVGHQDGSGHSQTNRQTKSIESQTREPSAANSPRPVDPPATLCTSVANENAEQGWISRQVQKLQAEIQTLKGNVVERSSTVASIDQDLCNLKEEYNIYEQTTSQDIVRELREIKQHYNTKLETLKSRLLQHAESRIKELDEEYTRNLDAHNWLQKEYDREFNDMTSRLLTLAESRRNEVNILNNNELERSRKAKVLACYEGIINYLNSEAKGGS